MSVDFRDIGMEIMGVRNPHTKANLRRRFPSWFGLDPHMCDIIWEELCSSGWFNFVRTSQKKHLLWDLMFLRQYNTTEIHAVQVGVDEKTFRRWAWFY